MLNIGHKSYVPISRVAGIYIANHWHDGIIDEALACGKCVYATKGRRRKSKIVMDSGHVIVSAVEASVLVSRMESA